jgi:hypothetical protein
MLSITTNISNIKIIHLQQVQSIYFYLLCYHFYFISIMGLKHAHAYTNSINKLSLKNIYDIALKRIPVDDDNKPIRERPSIDIDCSLLIRCRGIPNIVSNTQFLIKFCSVLQDIGFGEMVVFDGITRHHSKRSNKKDYNVNHSFQCSSGNNP